MVRFFVTALMGYALGFGGVSIYISLSKIDIKLAVGVILILIAIMVCLSEMRITIYHDIVKKLRPEA